MTEEKPPGCRLQKRNLRGKKETRPGGLAPKQRSPEKIEESKMRVQTEALESPVRKGPLCAQHDR